MKNKPATIKDVAREANCSIATVSCVLNNTNRISKSMQKRVHEVCKKLSYFPRSSGRNLRSRKTENIGILFYPSCAHIFSSGFYTTVMQGLEEELTRSNHNLILAGFDIAMQQGDLPKFIREGSVDGVILMGGCPEDFQQKLVDLRMPFIMLDSETPSETIDSIISDGFRAMMTMVDYLYSKGHRTLLMLRHTFDNYNEITRSMGFEAGCRRRGLTYEVAEVETNDQATEAIIERLGRDNPITAVCIVNDSMAADVSIKLSAAGIRVPDQISLTGFDDSLFALVANPPLTTIRIDKQLMGVEGAKAILRRINDANSPPRKIVISSELVERKSVMARRLPE